MHTPRHIGLLLSQVLVCCLAISPGYTTAQSPAASPEAARIDFFPSGDVFSPLLGDPKELHFFSGVMQGRDSVYDTAFIVAGFGQRFGLLRYKDLQLGIGSGLSLQFDILAESFDMLNTDYFISVPLTYGRGGAFSARLRFYHQSSHLGDELLLRTPPVRRLNYSYESFELLLSVRQRHVRVYGGGEYLMDREHDPGPSGLLHGGLEVHAPGRAWGLGAWGQVRLFGSIDLKAFEELDWETALTLRGGLKADLSKPGAAVLNHWYLLFEYTAGPAPYGQFYDQALQQFGLVLHLSPLSRRGSGEGR